MLQVRLKFVIRGGAFVPPPDVDVAVMHFLPKKEPLIPVSLPITGRFKKKKKTLRVSKA